MEIGGLSITAWVALWSGCHRAGFGGPDFIAWPDGKPLLEQPALTYSIFRLITEQVNLATKANNAK